MLVHPKTTGIIACCGSECKGGYISRAVAAKVITQLNVTQAVSISLPRLLIGTADEKRFSLNHPTITLDGCAKACAKKAVEKYCFKAIVGINIGDLIGEQEALATINIQDDPVQRCRVEIEKVSGIVTHVMDSLAAMYEKAQAAQKNSCNEGNCNCGCGGSSCGCGCEDGSQEISRDNQQVDGEPKTGGIVIYTKTGCPFCAKVLQEYREQGISFQEINTSIYPWAKKLCQEQYGTDKVPVVVKDGGTVQIGDSEGNG